MKSCWSTRFTKKHLLLSLFLLGMFSLNAQINVLWESRFTSAGLNIDSGKEITIDSSGNVYVTGTSYTNTTNGYDIVTIKYNSLGSVIWTKTFNGSGSALDEGRDIAVDKNGNVYVTGYTASTGPNYDYVTIKYNSAGMQQWASLYNGTGNGYDEAYSLAIDTSGNTYVTGGSDANGQGKNYVTIKYNSSGVAQWSTSYNGPVNGADAATKVVLDNQFNVYVTGNSLGNGTDLDIATIKYSNSGTQQWVHRYNGALNFFDIPEDITVDGIGNVYITGATYGGLATENDFVTLKINNSGSLDWTQLFDGPLNDEDRAFSILTDSELNVYVAGRSMGAGGTAENMVILKYDLLGNELWRDTYNGPASGYDEAKEMRLGSSGALYVTGYSAGNGTNNDYLTLKYDTANGDIIWEARFDGPDSNSDQAFAMEIDASESIYVTGTSTGSSTFKDYSTIKWCQLETDAGTDVEICLGDSIQLNANALGALSYSWSPSTGLSSISSPTPFAKPNTTTTYIVSSTNSLGCTDFDTVEVKVNNLPSNILTTNDSTSFCMGDSVIITAPVATSYLWSITGDTTQSTVAYTAGNYSVTITDSNNCIINGSENVTVYSLPNVSAGSDANLCNGDSMYVNASGAINYTWNTQTTLSDSTISNPLIYPTTTTTYWVVGENANGCVNADSIIIAISISPVSVIDPPAPNDTLDLSLTNGGDIQFFGSSSTNVIGYSWDFGTGDSDNISNPIYTYTTPGLFTVKLITSNGGCLDTAYMDIYVMNSIGVNELFSETEISLYPNPCDNYLNIKTNGSEKSYINILNSIGEVIMTSIPQNKPIQKINTSNLSPGIYFIEIFNKNSKIIKPFNIYH